MCRDATFEIGFARSRVTLVETIQALRTLAFTKRKNENAIFPENAYLFSAPELQKKCNRYLALSHPDLSLDWAHIVGTFVQKFHQIVLFIFMRRVTKQVLHLVWIVC